jgi:hypothetical protein
VGGSVQATAPDLLDRPQQLSLVSGRGKRNGREVVVEVEALGIHPQRVTKPAWRDVDDLPEPGDEVQALGDCLPGGLDAETTVRIKQAAAVQHGQGTDVLGPDLVRPQHHQIFGGQPLHLNFTPELSRLREVAHGNALICGGTSRSEQSSRELFRSTLHIRLSGGRAGGYEVSSPSVRCRSIRSNRSTMSRRRARIPSIWSLSMNAACSMSSSSVSFSPSSRSSSRSASAVPSSAAA